jgi:hypothetical protein
MAVVGVVLMVFLVKNIKLLQLKIMEKLIFLGMMIMKKKYMKMI